ncbi:MAG: hypothetical protein ABEJ76_04130 [Halanaeroarchaeum sp.]
MSSRPVTAVSVGLFVIALGTAVPFLAVPWLVAPTAASVALMSVGVLLVFAGYRRHRSEEGPDPPDGVRRIEGRAALSALTASFVLAGLLVALLGLTTYDPPAFSVFGPFFAAMGALWFGFRVWYRRTIK